MSTNKKNIKINSRNRERRKSAVSAMKSAIKKAEAAINAKKENAKELVRLAVVKIDKNVSNNIIHKNSGARRKSRLTLKLNKAGK